MQNDLLYKVVTRIYDTTGLLPNGALPAVPGDYTLRNMIVTPFLYVIQISPARVSTDQFTTKKLARDIKLVAELEQSEEIVIDVHKGFVTIQIPRPAGERGKVIYTSANVPRGSGLRVPLGLDILNEPIYFDFAREMNTNLSFLGVPGSGKSVSMRRTITTLAANNDNSQVKFLMIEVSKDGLDLRIFDRLAHLLHPVITNPAEAEQALAWSLAQIGRGKLPYRLFICIDEVAELVGARPATIKLLTSLVSQGRAMNVCNLLATQITDRDTLAEGKSIFKQVHNNILGKAPNKQLSYILGSQGDLGAEALTGPGDLKLSSTDITSRFAGIFTTRHEIEALPRVQAAARLPLANYTNVEAVIEDNVPRISQIRPTPADIIGEGLISLQRQVDEVAYRQAMAGREYYVLPVSRAKALSRNLAIFKERDQPHIVEIYKSLWRAGYQLCRR